MFNVDGMSGQNRDMTREALEIILKMWTEDAPWNYTGKFWTVNKPEHHVRFPQAPHQAEAAAPSADRGRRASARAVRHAETRGRTGYIPMSLNLNPAYVASHWESVEIGAARTGRKPNRADWRWCARCSSRNRRRGHAAVVRRHDGPDDGGIFLAFVGNFGFLEYLKPVRRWRYRVTAGTARRHNWLSARRRPWRRRSRRIYQEAGGFGRLLVFGSTTSRTPKPGTLVAAVET